MVFEINSSKDIKDLIIGYYRFVWRNVDDVTSAFCAIVLTVWFTLSLIAIVIPLTVFILIGSAIGDSLRSMVKKLKVKRNLKSVLK